VKQNPSARRAEKHDGMGPPAGNREPAPNLFVEEGSARGFHTRGSP
jgi:hypothetical protein